MEQLVPKDHFVRKIDKAINFELIRDEAAHLYCRDNVRPPVDRFISSTLSFFWGISGIKGERQFVKEIEVNVAYHWFLRMSLTEKVIHPPLRGLTKANAMLASSAAQNMKKIALVMSYGTKYS